MSSVLPTCTEESKHESSAQKMPRNDHLELFNQTKEPIRTLKNPIVARVPPNYPNATQKRGFYYVS